MITLNGTEISPTIFPDGTSQVWKLGDLIRRDRNSVKWDFENEAELFHLFQLSMLLRISEKGCFDNQLHIPYLPYARQDKNTTDTTTFAIRTFARILNQMHWNMISAFDIHSGEATRLIDLLVNIPPNLSFVEDYDFVIFPDMGACVRYEPIVLPYLGLDKSRIIVGEKTRDQETGYITSYNIDASQIAGKNVIVVDDLADGCKTFEILGEELLIAKQANLYVSHGLFSKGLSGLVSRYHTIITTDSREQHTPANQPYIDSGKLHIRPHLKTIH